MITKVKAEVEAVIAEYEAALEALRKEHNGLRNYARLDIEEDTRREINDAIEDYDRRVSLLARARTSLADSLVTFLADDAALTNDGYPLLPKRQISPAAVADLQEELEETAAGRSIFQVQATALGMTAGKTEPK